MFSCKTADRIRIDELEHPTAYMIEKGYQKMGLHDSIDSFHDRYNGNAEELLRFGHIASVYEKQVLADEKAVRYKDNITC